MARQLLWLTIVCVVTAPVQGRITDEQIETAMSRLEAYLWQEQDKAGGHWEHSYVNTRNAGGETALVVTAMLARGISLQHPKLSKAIEFLQRFEMIGTYPVALRAHVWAALPPIYHANQTRDAQWLIRAADRRCRFGYTADKRAPTNHSTTHYGVLGLWEVAKSRIVVPPDLWKSAEDYFLDVQNGDGGWGYDADEMSTGSMTAVGLTVLLIAQQQAHRGAMKPPRDLAAGIDDGLAWLDKRFDGGRNPSGDPWTNYYYLYALERVGLACGVRMLNGHDWFEAGARYILRDQDEDGSIDHSTVKSAFALMFLARGRHPVWITKLTNPDHEWNNRPNDIYYLNNYLSDLREEELNWQSVSIDAPLDHWSDAPAAYLATSKSIRLTGEQETTLKQYLDRGGTLLVNPDNGAASPGKSMRRLAAKWYPQWPVRELPRDHPIFSTLQSMGHTRYKVHGVSNGVRELMVIAKRDWGYTWQTSLKPGPAPSWRLAANFWAIVTDRGLLPPRVRRRFVERDERATIDAVRVGRVRYDGNWLPEPQAWAVFSDVLFNRTGLALATEDVDPAELHESNLPLVHLVGVDAVELNEEQLDALIAYARNGGTVLIETAGGRGDFSRSVEAALAGRLEQIAVPVRAAHPVISGEGMVSGYNARRVRYRRFAVATLSPGNWPRLAAFTFDDRPSMIISHEDFTQAMIRMNHWGVVGYDIESAEKLLTNLILWTRRRRDEARP